MNARGLWLGLTLALGGCDEAPPEGQLFDGIVQLRDLAASDGRVFVANDLATAVAAAPGAIDPDRLHDLIALVPVGGAYQAEGFFDATSASDRRFARRVAVDGARRLLYLGLGGATAESAVQILDSSDPDHPAALHLLPLAQPVSGLGARGNLLVVASPDGLHLFDVSEPSAPRPFADYTPPENAGTSDVTILGDRLYVAATGATGAGDEPRSLYPRLLVLDVSDAAHPLLLAERRIMSGFNGSGLAIAVGEGRVYLLADIGLDVYDVTDPARIERLGGVTRPATSLSPLFTDLAIVGDVALVTTQGEGLRVLDLRSPAQPVELATYPGTSAARSVAAAIAVGDGKAFVGLSRAGVRIVPIDADADGVLDVVDDCPSIANPTQADVDFDGVGDACDDCTLVADFDQADADADGYGNRCDPDFNGDGVVNFRDLARLKAVFLRADAVADLNVDGVVDFADLAMLKQRFFRPPGPSGKAPAN